MNKTRNLNVGLLSHYFTDNNLGCVALSICNMKLIDQAAAENNIPIHYIIYVNEKQPKWDLAFTNNTYEYRVFSSCKESVKHPIKLLTTKIFDGCNVVFNLCAGDGFTDIYGFGRVLSESYMSILAHKKGTRVILAPQTIGPFRKPHTRKIASYTMRGCDWIFTRDSQSTDFCADLKFNNKVKEVIDVAFALPYSVVEQNHDAINVGVNVSGLLYRGGYDYKNYFGLSFSYKDYIETLIPRLQEQGYRVHLIAHVVTADGSVEDDFVVCQELAQKYPGTVLMPRSESPIEVKSYIAGMDVFTGARMHATIGAFSAGVPVIPVAYSRKVNGLYGSLEYPYYIDAKAELSLTEAVKNTMQMVTSYQNLKANVERSKSIYTNKLQNYVDMVGNILTSI